MSEKYTEPKRRAQLVRQCVEAAERLAVLAGGLAASGEDLRLLSRCVIEAAESMLRACLKVQGVRVAGLAVADGKEDGQ